MRDLINLVENAQEGVPTVLYHGTFAHHLDSIRQHGLGGAVSRRNYDVSGCGVYLTDDPDAADLWASDNQYGNAGEVVVLEIDMTKLDPLLLRGDENDEGEYGGTSYVYNGVIPPSALSILA